jgi:8-oxo-dGTP diphosphatase
MKTPGHFSVGVNIFVIKHGRELLLGKRKNAFGAGTWGLPGGHLKFGEAIEEAAKRELMEETGLEAQTLEFINLVNDRGIGRHYLEVAFLAQQVAGEPTVREPEKSEEWKWYDLNNLPNDLFPPHAKPIELFRRNLRFSDLPAKTSAAVNPLSSA